MGVSNSGTVVKPYSYVPSLSLTVFSAIKQSEVVTLDLCIFVCVSEAAAGYYHRDGDS